MYSVVLFCKYNLLRKEGIKEGGKADKTLGKEENDINW